VPFSMVRAQVEDLCKWPANWHPLCHLVDMSVSGRSTHWPREIFDAIDLYLLKTDNITDTAAKRKPYKLKKSVVSLPCVVDFTDFN
jgi:hypothetical protein